MCLTLTGRQDLLYSQCMVGVKVQRKKKRHKKGCPTQSVSFQLGAAQEHRLLFPRPTPPHQGMLRYSEAC